MSSQKKKPTTKKASTKKPARKYGESIRKKTKKK